MPKRKRKSIKQKPKKGKKRKPICPACSQDLSWCHSCQENLCTDEDCEAIRFYACALCGSEVCGNVFPACANVYSVGSSCLVVCSSCLPDAVERYILCVCEEAVTERYRVDPDKKGGEKSLCGTCAKTSCHMCRAVMLRSSSHEQYCESCYISKVGHLLWQYMPGVITQMVIEYADIGMEYQADSDSDEE